MILNSTAESLNPNPILVAFRADLADQNVKFPHRNSAYLAEKWAGRHGLSAIANGYPTYSGIWELMQAATPEQIDQARRVLNRLANWQES